MYYDSWIHDYNMAPIYSYDSDVADEKESGIKKVSLQASFCYDPLWQKCLRETFDAPTLHHCPVPSLWASAPKSAAELLAVKLHCG